MTRRRRARLFFKQQLAGANSESLEKAKSKVSFYQEQTRAKRAMIENFARLSVTALRTHFSDPELDDIFRVLSFELLEQNLGPGGIELRDEIAVKFRFGMSVKTDCVVEIG